MKRLTSLGEVLTLPSVVKSQGGSPLLEQGHVTFLLSEVKSVGPMHFSWWWSGWESVTTRQPNAALNAKYYEKYPAALGGEKCCVVSFKDGTSEMVRGCSVEVTGMIFGDVN